ncbi:MAG: hypothetical protein IH946_06235 [Bacteroidetes bacterium]|nr:hypothetical protein [Bacteroidota bacterium]
MDFILTNFEEKVVPYENSDQIMFSSNFGDTIILKNRGRSKYLQRTHILEGVSDCSPVGIYDLESDTTTFYSLDSFSFIKKVEIFLGYFVDDSYTNDVDLQLRIKINPFTQTKEILYFDVHDLPEYSELVINGNVYKDVYFTSNEESLEQVYYTKADGIIRFSYLTVIWSLLK